MSTVKLKGCTHFRQRVICSTLSGRPLVLSGIRSDDEEPGLRDFEGSFLRLVDQISNGCQVEINETGTVLRYKPGIITGGQHSHHCGAERSIAWFLEGILPLAAFAKEPLRLSLTGITNDMLDASVDSLRAVTLPLLAQFGIEGASLQVWEGLPALYMPLHSTLVRLFLRAASLPWLILPLWLCLPSSKVKRRGMAPLGGGLVEFSCPIVRQLRPLNLVDPGLVKRIRGVAYCAKISPQFANRVVHSGRELLNRLLPDVYIHTDHYKGVAGGDSPGYGLSLVAESTTGCMVAIDNHAAEGAVPEDVGQEGSALLLEEVRRGGCVGSTDQSLVVLLMALGPEDVSRLRTGPLTAYTIQTLRHVRDFFGVTFKIVADAETCTVMLSCLGTGYRNLAKKVT